jgi:hypothetical protein
VNHPAKTLSLPLALAAILAGGIGFGHAGHAAHLMHPAGAGAAGTHAAATAFVGHGGH